MKADDGVSATKDGSMKANDGVASKRWSVQAKKMRMMELAQRKIEYASERWNMRANDKVCKRKMNYTSER